jgi:glycosyltransferase involved in cell wall biosynthesis
MVYRVLYLAGSSGRGGVETFLKSLQKHHSPGKFAPYFFLLQAGPLGESLVQAGGRLAFARTRFRLRNPASFFRLVQEIRAEIRREKIDLLHSSMAYMALAGSVAAWLEGIPHIWFQHGPVGGWMDWLAGNLPFDCLLANSRYTLAQQERWPSWQSKAKNRVLPLGTEVAPLSEMEARNPLCAVMLCRAQRWKGADLFSRAILELKQRKVPVEGRIFLAEGESEVRRELEAAKSLSIREPLSDPTPALIQADILVNASRTPEPFGLTLIEAMASGVVPVAPRAGGPLEIIEDGVDGVLFSPGDPADLAGKIKALVENPARFRQIRQNAHRSAAQKFSVEIMVARLEEIYLEILAKRPRAIAGQENSRS